MSAAVEYCINANELAIDCILHGKRKSLCKTAIISKNVANWLPEVITLSVGSPVTVDWV